MTADAVELTINYLGRHGDGVAETPNGEVYIPLTLEGEKVLAEVIESRGILHSVVSPSDLRRKAFCQHYSACGGCSLQHMSEESYFVWKSKVVQQAFAKAGIEIEPQPVISVPDRSRRRAVMEIRRTKKTIQFGFHGRKSSDIVSIEDCHVVSATIQSQLENLKTLLKPILSRKGVARLGITETVNGLDLSVSNVNKELTAEIREEIGRDARKFGIARITVNDEPVVTLADPVVRFGDVDVEISPGGFLQATVEAEQAMTAIMLEALDGAKHVADLFCGMGTFSLPIARSSEVTAVEYDKDALGRLRSAYHNAQGLKPVHVSLRDLHREPLSAKELDVFDGVVFDPPRSGARLQAEQIANSSVPVVVAVSCNPATMARDVRTLIDGGYTLTHVTPVDQFKYSSHIEAVAVLTK